MVARKRIEYVSAQLQRAGVLPCLICAAMPPSCTLSAKRPLAPSSGVAAADDGSLPHANSSALSKPSPSSSLPPFGPDCAAFTGSTSTVSGWLSARPPFTCTVSVPEYVPGFVKVCEHTFWFIVKIPSPKSQFHISPRASDAAENCTGNPA